MDDKIQELVSGLVEAIRDEVREEMKNEQRGELSCTAARSDKQYQVEHYRVGFGITRPLA